MGRWGRRRPLRSRRLAMVLLTAAVGSGVVVSGAGAVTSGPFSFGAPALIDAGAPYGAPAAFDTLSCPSASLCVGDTGAFGQIVTSTNPSGALASDWSVLNTSYVLIGVSCVTEGAGPFCLAVGTNPADPFGPGNDELLRSTNPAGGSSAWTVERFAPSSLDGPPSCAPGASGVVCVATNSSGLVWATGDAETAGADGEAGSSNLAGRGCQRVSVGCDVFHCEERRCGAQFRRSRIRLHLDVRQLLVDGAELDRRVLVSDAGVLHRGRHGRVRKSGRDEH